MGYAQIIAPKPSASDSRSGFAPGSGIADNLADKTMKPGISAATTALRRPRELEQLVNLGGHAAL